MSSFISRGDFMFPFDYTVYWLKHFYTWSYQNGALNLDGIIRAPSRALTLVVFALSDNIIASYFYFFSSMLIIFLAFYAFAFHFLDIKDRRVRLLGALFFACNPIFLGYSAKIGLMVGAAMLPLCFIALRQAFLKRQFHYFVLYILLLNVSLIHPFTFTVNILASGIYLVQLLRKNGRFVWSHKTKTLGIFALGLILNAYFLIPVISLGTVSKSALSSDITSGAPADYTSLVDVANTRDPFTALSLSRDVFLDFDYYSPRYAPIYFAAVFAFYMILLGLFIYNEEHLNKRDRKRLTLLFGLFLALLLLSMTTFFHVNTFTKLLTGLPGGWMFRSPLKWQLYIPFVISTVLCLLLSRTPVKKIRSMTSVTIVASVVLMGLFLSVGIYRQLLTPHTFKHLGALQAMDLNQKNLLFIDDNECFSFLQENPDITTEMNQIFASKNVQVKHIKSAGVETVNLGAYDYVFGCAPSLSSSLKDETRFEQMQILTNKDLALYRNRQSRPYIYAVDRLFLLDHLENLQDKYIFSSETPKSFDIVKDTAGQPVHDLVDPFESIRIDNIKSGTITTTSHLTNSGLQQLFITDQNTKPIYYKAGTNQVSLSSQPHPDFELIKNKQLPLSTSADALTFTYIDSVQERKNLINNPSLEDGLWQDKVWDCHAYDNQPSIAMNLTEEQAAEGKKSLELLAKRHIACTGPPPTKVTHDANYVLYFRYKNTGKSPSAGYHIRFDDTNHTAETDYLPAGNDVWQEFSRQIEVPEGASHMQLTLYAYPDNTQGGGQVFFDDFKLLEIPRLQNMFFLTNQPKTTTGQPNHLSYDDINPTSKRVRVKGASKPFYLGQRDTYHDQWEARLSTGNGIGVSPQNHLKLNGFMNGWYIDPATLCTSANSSCTRHSDGSYDFDILVGFKPQRWFYAGLLVSGIGFIGVAVYFGYLGVRRYRKGGKRYWRWR
jgi:hypothetical protein